MSWPRIPMDSHGFQTRIPPKSVAALPWPRGDQLVESKIAFFSAGHVRSYLYIYISYSNIAILLI